jgi:DNA-binding XRE family transcriptional regulator
LRQPGTPSRLQQNVARRRDSQVVLERHDRIHRPLLKRVDDTIRRGHAPAARPGPRAQLAETRKQLALDQKQIAAATGVSVARVSQIEHGEVTSLKVIARYVEALGGRLDLVADFGDRTVRLPVSETATAA